MRRNAISSAVQEENDEINLTPMLDVVFIMLSIFSSLISTDSLTPYYAMYSSLLIPIDWQ